MQTQLLVGFVLFDGLTHRGYRATTHWLSLGRLPLLGAEAVGSRVGHDGNRITAAGVTAGIELGLTLAAMLFGPAEAQRIQLAIEYDPAPPFDSGSPRTASPDIRAAARKRVRVPSPSGACSSSAPRGDSAERITAAPVRRRAMTRARAQELRSPRR
jgi:hypothetical protein